MVGCNRCSSFLSTSFTPIRLDPLSIPTMAAPPPAFRCCCARAGPASCTLRPIFSITTQPNTHPSNFFITHISAPHQYQLLVPESSFSLTPRDFMRPLCFFLDIRSYFPIYIGFPNAFLLDITPCSLYG